MPHILITGGLGFIGSHVAVTLLNKGYSIIIIDNLYNSKENVLEKIIKIILRKSSMLSLGLCLFFVMQLL